MASVAILTPTHGRAGRLPDVVANAQHPDATVYLIMEPDDAHEVPGAITLTRPQGFGSYATAILHGYRSTTEPLLFAAADDLNFHPGWLEAATALLSDGTLVVGTNDLGNPEVLSGDHATHYLVDRRYLDETGGRYDEGPGSFLAECYDHNWTDREFIEVAKLRGVWKPCLESVVEHMHVGWGKAPMDQGYRRSFAHEPSDAVIYADRIAQATWRLAPRP